ncbi:MAG: helix-turn-helix domain-containing protein [Cellulomonadaceae bacterium]|jgi:excisionase family DNA binding protein|nr:helix-turn-helix domain-containing protein [Cellulomonadaceae bacterium]
MATLTLSPEMTDDTVLSFIRNRLAAGERVQITATEPFMTPQEVAESIGASRAFVMQKLKSGALTSTRRGTRHRISESEVDRFRAALVSDHWAAVTPDVEDELFGNE